MINPWLRQRLFEFPVRPVLVEVQTEVLETVLGSFLGRGLAVRNVIRRFSMIGLIAVPSKLIPAIDALPGVRAVHADLQINALQLPAAPDQALWYPTSESRQVLEAELAFKQGWTGEAVRLGVVDTGIDPTHQQLVGSEWDSAISFPFREVLDENGHGSHVASTAAGKLAFTDVGIFAEGVSRAAIYSVKALGRGVGTGFTSEVVNAMAMALERGAQVVNMSLGSKECQGGCEICPECRAVKRLSDRGVLVAVAAGNSGPDPDTIGCPGRRLRLRRHLGDIHGHAARGGAVGPSQTPQPCDERTGRQGRTAPSRRAIQYYCGLGSSQMVVVCVATISARTSFLDSGQKIPSNNPRRQEWHRAGSPIQSGKRWSRTPAGC